MSESIKLIEKGKAMRRERQRSVAKGRTKCRLTLWCGMSRTFGSFGNHNFRKQENYVIQF